ncbi:MAG: hypothetical protein ACHQAY_10120 [Hyphomicrobiales bacterium]
MGDGSPQKRISLSRAFVILAFSVGVISVAGIVYFVNKSIEKKYRDLLLRRTEASLGIARAEVEGEHGKSSAVRAKKGAETLRKRNLEAQDALSPKLLEQVHFAEALKPYAGMHVFVVYSRDFDARRLAGQIADILRRAEWNLEPLLPGPEEEGENIQYGVEVEYVSGPSLPEKEAPPSLDFNKSQEAAAATLIEQFKQNRVDAQLHRIPAFAADWWRDNRFPLDALVIRIGKKPLTFTGQQRLDELTKGNRQ